MSGERIVQNGRQIVASVLYTPDYSAAEESLTRGGEVRILARPRDIRDG
jgi:hypothetical protein